MPHPPKGHLAQFEDNFGSHNWGGVPGECYGHLEWWALLNVLQCTGQYPLPTKNDAAQNINTDLPQLTVGGQPNKDIINQKYPKSKCI